MIEYRGNATIAYVNNKYAYVIGGYKLVEKQQGGIYHGNCEYIDLDNMHLGWKIIDFGDNSLKFSAMGVIQINENIVLLCGGFDGLQYREDVYKVNFSDKDRLVVDRMNINLPEHYIFLHNNFIRIDDCAYNIELNNSVLSFSYNNWVFNVQEPS